MSEENRRRLEDLFKLLRPHVAGCDACRESRLHICKMHDDIDALAEQEGWDQRTKNMSLSAARREHRDECDSCVEAQVHVDRIVAEQ